MDWTRKVNPVNLVGQIVIAAVSIIVLALLQLAWRSHSHTGGDSTTPPT